VLLLYIEQAELRWCALSYGPIRGHPAVWKDVRHTYPKLVEHTGDEEVAMALRRIPLAAEHGYPVLGGALDQPLDSLTEQGRLRQSVVANVTLDVVELIALWPSPQLASEKDVVETPGAKCPGEVFPIEVRGVSRKGGSTYICNHIDPCRPQETEERGEIVVGVTDGEHTRPSIVVSFLWLHTCHCGTHKDTAARSAPAVMSNERMAGTQLLQ
jgi:hypothetical protein